jgi:hypothetical protein
MFSIIYKRALKDKLTMYLSVEFAVLFEAKRMASKMELTLEILSDGKWHGIDELEQRLDLNEHEVLEITLFLNRYDFAFVDDARRKVKLSEDFRKFLSRSLT